MKYAYEFFRFPTLGSIFQYTPIIMSNASSLHMTRVAGKEQNSFQQLIEN